MINLDTERMKGFGVYEVDGMQVNYLYGLKDLCDFYFVNKDKPPFILELGTNDGISASLFSNYGIVTTVDLVSKQEAKSNCIDSVYPVIFIISSFRSFFTSLSNSYVPYDLIYIDGDHSYEAVSSDINTAINYLNINGILAGHDYNRMTSGVITAVNEIAEKLNKTVHVFNDSSWAIKL